MDFSYTEDQTAIRELARQVFEDQVPTDKLLGLLQDPGWYSRDTWAALAQSSLLGVALPESVGGAGMGFEELCLVLHESGRRAAPTPILPTLVMAAAPIAEFGTEAQQQALLPEVISGQSVLTAALVEDGFRDPANARTEAVADGTGFRITGTKTCVPAAAVATRILVPAKTGDGKVGVFLVDPAADGVTLEDQEVTNGEPHSLLRMENVAVGAEDVLGDPHEGAGLIKWIADRTMVAACAVAVGLAESGLEQTAAYQTERRQFGVPIGSFQGTQIRAADAWIDVEAMRATFQQAVWRLSTGRDADKAIEVAKWWACRAGHRVAHACQHLHGGMGADVEYPIHRWFLAAKQNEVILGGASQHQAKIGELIAGTTGAAA